MSINIGRFLASITLLPSDERGYSRRLIIRLKPNICAKSLADWCINRGWALICYNHDPAEPLIILRAPDDRANIVDELTTHIRQFIEERVLPQMQTLG